MNVVFGAPFIERKERREEEVRFLASGCFMFSVPLYIHSLIDDEREMELG
jgi:hypothetical protein